MKIKGTGIDIIEVDRIKKALDRWGDAFINHIFTAEEITYCQKHKFPAQNYAARFAAKEAIYKAVGDNPHLGWKDIQILKDNHGKPYCTILNHDVSYQIHVSLSHTENYATAHAIVTE